MMMIAMVLDACDGLRHQAPPEIGSGWALGVTALHAVAALDAVAALARCCRRTRCCRLRHNARTVNVARIRACATVLRGSGRAQWVELYNIDFRAHFL